MSSLISPSPQSSSIELLQIHNLIIFIISTIPKHNIVCVLCCIPAVKCYIDNLLSFYYSVTPLILIIISFFCMLLRLLLLFFVCFASSTYIFLYTQQNLRITQNLFYMLLLFTFFFICRCLFPLSYVVHISYNNSFYFLCSYFFYFYLFIYIFRCPSHSLSLSLARSISFTFIYFYLFFSIK